MNKDYYFFWGGECSQWAESPFEEFGVTFNCAEQFMMAAKAKVFGDDNSYNAIMATRLPNEQKALGKKVKGFDANIWDAIAKNYVRLGNVNKFQQNEQFLDFLFKHKDKYFVEASPYDKVWGIGLAETHPDIHDPLKWQGTNWLGECINEAATLMFETGHEGETEIENLRNKLNWMDNE